MRRWASLLCLSLSIVSCQQFRVTLPQEQLDAEEPADAVSSLDNAREDRAVFDAIDARDTLQERDVFGALEVLDAVSEPREDAASDVLPERPMGCASSNELYFDGAVTTVATEEIFSDGRSYGTLSPDGLRFANGANYTVYEFGRSSLSAPFRLLNSYYTWAELAPILSGDLLEMWTIHGGEVLTFRLRRSSPSQPFERAYAPASALPLYGSTEFSAAAAHVWAIASPDRRYVVFESNRASSSDGAGPRGGMVFHVYSAEFVDPTDSSRGVRSVRLEAMLNADGARNSPQWLSDDGLVLYFVSDRAGTYDVYRSRRADVSSAFQAPELVSALSDGERNDQGFTLPSLATIRANGCQSDGLLHRSLTATRLQAYRFRACLGAPCP